MRLSCLNYFALIALCVGFSSCKEQSHKTVTSDKKTNVVFILVDDMGWTDVKAFGSDYYQTPNIDALAKTGAKFTNAYAACNVCSPTRASVMTGKYPASINCTDWITGWKYPYAKLKVPEWTMMMDTSEYTMAEAFRNSGYKTAHIGKWHLGEDSLYWPENQGFDINIGGWSKGAPNRSKKRKAKGYFSPYGNPRMTDGPEGEYLTERLADEACKFIRENKNSPFFLNLWFYNVHTPLMAKKEKIEKYKTLVDSSKKQKNPVYAAMVEHTDDAVGKVIGQLKESGLLENTIVVFTSDNGGLIGNNRKKITNNYPLRSGKGDMYEGGVRVPLIMYAPGMLNQGAVSEELAISCDYFPTLVELCNLDVPKSVKEGFDGTDLSPVLKGENIKRDVLFWHYPHYHLEGAKPHTAVRKGDWKLIHLLEDNKYELYDLKADISESLDVSFQEPEKVEELKKEMKEMMEKTEAQLPSVNPDHDPEKETKVGY